MKFSVNGRKFAIFGSNRKDVQVVFAHLNEDEMVDSPFRWLCMYDGCALSVSETKDLLEAWSTMSVEDLMDNSLNEIEEI